MGKYWRAKYYILTILVIIVLSIVIYKNLNWITKNPIEIWTILATVFSIHSVLYRYAKKYYLWINHYLYTLVNKSFYWNFSIDFWGHFDNSFEDELRKQFSVVFDNRIKYFDANTFSGDGFTIQFNFRDDQENPETDELQRQLHIEIFDSNINYNDLIPILEIKISKVINFIERALNHPSEQIQMSIIFKGKNPYYGFFIQKLNLNQINNFNVDFYLDQKHRKNYVKVTKKAISVSTNTSVDLINIAKKIGVLSNSGS